MFQRSLFVLSLVVLALSFVACAKPQGDDRLREKADIDARSGQEAIDNRARAMEARLLRQQRFYQALNGTFVGEMKSQDFTFDVRFIISPTIPVYDGDRVRSVDEITYDLTNLAFNIEELSTGRRGKSGERFPSGCVYNLLKAKIDEGYVLATTEKCAVSYTINVGTKTVTKDGRVKENSSPDMARKVLDGEIETIDKLSIEMRSVHFEEVRRFEVFREH